MLEKPQKERQRNTWIMRIIREKQYILVLTLSINCYINNLTEIEKQNVQSFQSTTDFKFRDENNVASDKFILISCKIAGKSVKI